MDRIFPKLTATRLQATTYLLGIALFSIAFLVFLNSSISFVVTEVIGQKEDVGDAVGSLGFADELLALVACPLWGLLSDRIGVRTVAVAGYCIVGLSLICLVKSTNVYPELLMGRLGFSIGGAACSTMVTAVLPAMVAKREDEEPKEEAEEGEQPRLANGHAARLREEEGFDRRDSVGHGTSPSVSSDLTITQGFYSSRSQTLIDDREAGQPPGGDGAECETKDKTAGTSQLAGFVGFFTGAGALLALGVFLPLPAHFQNMGQSQAQSVRTSYYIVGAIAFCVAVLIYFGLRDLPGENEKSFSALWQTPYDETTERDSEGHLHTRLTPAPSYFTLATEATKLGFTDSSIGLGYLGGFVARASSVGISLFIPLFVNAYFVRNGLCTSNPDDLTDIKKNCQRAYALAAGLTGIAETAALLCAPLFGILGGRLLKGQAEWPLLGAAIVGIGGYVAFGFLNKPDPFHGDGGQWALIAVVLIGISQIGAIVCSLGLLGRGISHGTVKLEQHRPSTPTTMRPGEAGPSRSNENAPLLSQSYSKDAGQHEFGRTDRSHLKGSIAGIYSLTGGAGILLLTKLGGALFDSWTAGAPFFLLAIFNGILAIAIVLIVGVGALLRKHKVNVAEVFDAQ